MDVLNTFRFLLLPVGGSWINLNTSQILISKKTSLCPIGVVCDDSEIVHRIGVLKVIFGYHLRIL
jgi:hypothetical protein